MRRHGIIQQKRLVLVGCEGSSEASYAALLQAMVRELNLPIALKVEELSPGAGDALARMQLLAKKIEQHRKRGTRFATNDRFALLDFAQPANGQNRTNEAEALASQQSVQIIWQIPSFEALLLRHFDGHMSRQLNSAEHALGELKKVWSDYRKPVPRTKLSEVIDLAMVRRLADLEPALGNLLRRLRLL